MGYSVTFKDLSLPLKFAVVVSYIIAVVWVLGFILALIGG